MEYISTPGQTVILTPAPAGGASIPNNDISINHLKAAFGGSASPKISDYYRGGGLVPNPLPAGSYPGGPIPTSGPINFSHFRGLQINPSGLWEYIFQAAGSYYVNLPPPPSGINGYILEFLIYGGGGGGGGGWATGAPTSNPFAAGAGGGASQSAFTPGFGPANPGTHVAHSSAFWMPGNQQIWVQVGAGGAGGVSSTQWSNSSQRFALPGSGGGASFLQFSAYNTPGGGGSVVSRNIFANGGGGGEGGAYSRITNPPSFSVVGGYPGGVSGSGGNAGQNAFAATLSAIQFAMDYESSGSPRPGWLPTVYQPNNSGVWGGIYGGDGGASPYGAGGAGGSYARRVANPGNPGGLGAGGGGGAADASHADYGYGGNGAAGGRGQVQLRITVF